MLIKANHISSIVLLSIYKIVLFHIIYIFSYKYNIAEFKYDIIFFDKQNNIIKPSDLALFNKLHIICQVGQNFLGFWLILLINFNII